MKSKLVIFILITVTFFNCTKKREEKFPFPLELFLLIPSQTYEVLKSPKPTAQVLGKISGNDKTQAIATIVLLEKTGDQKFLQITCPSNLSCDKEGGYIYLNNAHISGCKECADVANSNLTALLIESSEVEKATLTRDWIQNPKKQIPENLDEKILLACLSAIQNEKDRNARIIELDILFSVLKDPTQLKDPRLEFLRSKYSAMDTIYKIFKEGDGSGWETDPLSKIQIPESLSKAINTMAIEQSKNIVIGFPFRGESWVALVKEFNSLKTTVYAQDLILSEAIKNTEYEVITAGETKNTSDLTLSVRKLEGSFLLIIASQYEIQSITAEVDKMGLKFKIKIQDGELILKPVNIPAYFAAGGPGFKQFLANIPGDYNKIREENSFSRAFMLTLLKFGKGGYNSQTDTMEYTLDLSEKENYYWMMYNLIKKSPIIELTGNGHTGNINFIMDPKFRQPAGEFIISYTDGCGDGGCQREATCFSKNNGKFILGFSPSEINNTDPHIKVALGDDFDIRKSSYSKDGVCHMIVEKLPGND